MKERKNEESGNIDDYALIEGGKSIISSETPGGQNDTEFKKASDAEIAPYRSDFFNEPRKHLNDDSDKELAGYSLQSIQARTQAFLELKEKTDKFIEQLRQQADNESDDLESILIKNKQKQLILTQAYWNKAYADEIEYLEKANKDLPEQGIDEASKALKNVLQQYTKSIEDEINKLDGKPHPDWVKMLQNTPFDEMSKALSGHLEQFETAQKQQDQLITAIKKAKPYDPIFFHSAEMDSKYNNLEKDHGGNLPNIENVLKLREKRVDDLIKRTENYLDQELSKQKPADMRQQILQIHGLWINERNLAKNDLEGLEKYYQEKEEHGDGITSEDNTQKIQDYKNKLEEKQKLLDSKIKNLGSLNGIDTATLDKWEARFQNKEKVMDLRNFSRMHAIEQQKEKLQPDDPYFFQDPLIIEKWQGLNTQAQKGAKVPLEEYSNLQAAHLQDVQQRMEEKLKEFEKHSTINTNEALDKIVLTKELWRIHMKTNKASIDYFKAQYKDEEKGDILKNLEAKLKESNEIFLKKIEACGAAHKVDMTTVKSWDNYHESINSNNLTTYQSYWRAKAQGQSEAKTGPHEPGFFSDVNLIRAHNNLVAKKKAGESIKVEDFITARKDHYDRLIKSANQKLDAFAQQSSADPDAQEKLQEKLIVTKELWKQNAIGAIKELENLKNVFSDNQVAKEKIEDYKTALSEQLKKYQDEDLTNKIEKCAKAHNIDKANLTKWDDHFDKISKDPLSIKPQFQDIAKFYAQVTKAQKNTPENAHGNPAPLRMKIFMKPDDKQIATKLTNTLTTLQTDIKNAKTAEGKERACQLAKLQSSLVDDYLKQFAQLNIPNEDAAGNTKEYKELKNAQKSLTKTLQAQDYIPIILDPRLKPLDLSKPPIMENDKLIPTEPFPGHHQDRLEKLTRHLTALETNLTFEKKEGEAPDIKARAVAQAQLDYCEKYLEENNLKDDKQKSGKKNKKSKENTPTPLGEMNAAMTKLTEKLKKNYLSEEQNKELKQETEKYQSKSSQKAFNPILLNINGDSFEEPAKERQRTHTFNTKNKQDKKQNKKQEETNAWFAEHFKDFDTQIKEAATADKRQNFCKLAWQQLDSAQALSEKYPSKDIQEARKNLESTLLAYSKGKETLDPKLRSLDPNNPTKITTNGGIIISEPEPGRHNSNLQKFQDALNQFSDMEGATKTQYIAAGQAQIKIIDNYLQKHGINVDDEKLSKDLGKTLKTLDKKKTELQKQIDKSIEQLVTKEKPAVAGAVAPVAEGAEAAVVEGVEAPAAGNKNDINSKIEAEINKLAEKYLNEAKENHHSYPTEVNTQGVVSKNKSQAPKETSVQRSRSHNIVQPNMPLQRPGVQVITTAPQMAHTIVQTNMPASVQVITIPPQRSGSYTHQTPTHFKERYTTYQSCHAIIQRSSDRNIYIITPGPSAPPIQSGLGKNQQVKQGIQVG